MKLYLQRFQKHGSVFISKTPVVCFESTEFTANPDMLKVIDSAGVGGPVFVVRSLKPANDGRSGTIIHMAVFQSPEMCMKFVEMISHSWSEPLTPEEVRKASEQFFRNAFGQHSVQSYPAGRDGWSPADTEFVSFFAATVR